MKAFRCFYCNDTGAIVAISDKNQALYAFRCSCGTRFDANKNYPVWRNQKGYSTDFSPPAEPAKVVPIAPAQPQPKPQPAPMANIKPPKRDYAMERAEPKSSEFAEDDMPW